MVEVKFKRFNVNASIPTKATELAGGFDVKVTRIEKIGDDLVICYLGFGLQPPNNYKITLVPRSSLTNTKWILQNTPGLGDADYINEYQLRFRALPESISKSWYEGQSQKLTYPSFPYEVGDRVGQIYLEEVIPTKFVEVDELVETNRTGGYGSTGK